MVRLFFWTGLFLWYIKLKSIWYFMALAFFICNSLLGISIAYARDTSYWLIVKFFWLIIIFYIYGIWRYIIAYRKLSKINCIKNCKFTTGTCGIGTIMYRSTTFRLNILLDSSANSKTSSSLRHTWKQFYGTLLWTNMTPRNVLRNHCPGNMW